jgi:hypothetical protein
MKNQEIFNMACNPDPEILAPCVLCNGQNKKQNETKKLQNCAKNEHEHKSREGKRGLSFPRNGICEDDNANFEAN